MLVYRLCKIGEVNKLLKEKSFENVGTPGQLLIERQHEKNVNNHVYDYQKTYLHFYKRLQSIFYLYTEDKYLCTYDIPDEILAKYQGYGFYYDYRDRSRAVSTVEYAIDINELSFNYLCKIDRIIEYIDYEDYLYDPTLQEELETIYSKERRRIRRKDD